MIRIDDLTVGQVSGMIAAAIFVLQILVPLALPLVMLGLMRLRGGEVAETAVSWSVVARFFHSSLWPTILQTHSSKTFSTPISVLFVSLLRPTMITLVGIAAIVTPLGLYETIAPARASSPQPFHYIQDTSPIGLGTPPRTDATWSRKCGWVGWIACPNSGNNITRIVNSTHVSIEADDFSTKVPEKVVEAFQSGLSAFSNSVSSSFDIQYRSTTTLTQKKTDGQMSIDNGTAYDVGTYRPLSTILLSDEIGVYEGLIVDMKQGGLGFRNHTAPPWTRYGSTWDEDILFIEPESVCVDTNLTLDFEIPKDMEFPSDKESNLVLTDRGGFVNINRTYPRWDHANSQRNPDLWLRAYKAAFVNNVISMAFMNVTNLGNPNVKAFRYLNSSLGKEFSLHWKDGKTASTGLSIEASRLQITQSWGGYLTGTDEGKANYTGFNSSEGGTPKSLEEEPLYTDPFDVGFRYTGITHPSNRTTFSDAGLLCEGAGGSDLANITNAVASCGLLYGAPRRRDGSASLLFHPGSSWTLPMFSCISTVKASLKTVSFRFNGTDTLAGLSVTNITPKVYFSESEKPLWGVENSGDMLSDVKPLWGLVTPEAARKLNLSTLRSEKLYIPGYSQGDMSDVTSQNLPAVDFPAMALGKVYAVGSSDAGEIDYSGATNLAMYRLWQELSREAGTAHKILNLIWTDVAANLVLGTRSLETREQELRKRDGVGESEAQTSMVTMYERRIRYRYVYGIPAFLVLALASLILVSSLLLVVLGPAKLGYLRVVLEQTSAGRLLTLGTHGDGDSQVFTLGSEGWRKGVVSVDGGSAKGGSEVKYHRVNGDEEVEEDRRH